jgi:hypothetical protein
LARYATRPGWGGGFVYLSNFHRPAGAATLFFKMP